jgi:hypothetical protein
VLTNTYPSQEVIHLSLKFLLRHIHWILIDIILKLDVLTARALSISLV